MTHLVEIRGLNIRFILKLVMPGLVPGIHVL
jgi:hypothetical protein